MLPLRVTRATGLLHCKQLHTLPTRRLPYKNSQDRNSLRPQSAEHTKSARDDDASQATKAAFDPQTTSPEAETRQAGDTLDASGANQALSKPRGDETDRHGQGAGKEVRKGGASGGASPPKGGSPGRV
ncbi:hypothetical protein CDD81_450 [Ophiocordyceps australis]|uniref:Uncharacterized protein n=1 Tax=Ophiocordyceps australis TaxID=1399860 RepID=A0A2C5Y2B0_9HYPO|nr:hypothetical protein CDD81_450 [Ophiocordyceps australis]